MAWLHGKRVDGVIAGAVVLLSLSLAAPIRAQVVGATLSGTVTDQSGAMVPNAQISIKNTATGITTNVTTNSAGLYTAPNLIPGPYQVKISAQGFNTVVHSGITLTVGAQQVLNITMQVGAVTQTIQVSGAAPAVQLATSSISATVNSTTVRQLPLNGRSWTDLAKLQPGVDAIQTQPTFAKGGDRGNRGFGDEITISGERPQFNNYRMDGISMNDYSNGAPGSVLGGNLGVDAIQEFSVLTSNYSAEYGKTAGGVVNAITRSGTNQFHGDVYEFLRNSALDARNFFDPGSAPPPFRRNQFGASAGGPIQRDKTFIFGDFEAIRQSLGISDVSTVPSVAARAGNLTEGTVTVDPSAAKYLALYPLPNGQVRGDIAEFIFPIQQVINETFFTARLDHKISDKDSVFGTYMYDDTPYHSPDNFDLQLIGSHTNRQIVVLEENHIFSPSFVNTVRAGYNREGAANNQSISAINPLAKDTSLGAVPGKTAADMRIGGVSEMLGGLNSLGTFFYYWNDFQGYDDAFWMHGTHSIKFGVAVERMNVNMISFSTPTGQFNFGSVQSFLTNHPKKFASQIISTLTPRGERQTLFGAYVQDDWRTRPNLTLNLGLRYEMTTVPTEVQNKLSNLIHITDATQHLGNPYFQNPTLRDFEPRVGFAWDPFHNGKTALRGGWGLFDVLPLPYQNNLLTLQSAPFFLLGSVNNPPAGSFFAGAYPLLTLNTFRQSFIEYNPPRQYVMQWNFNIQHALTPSTTLTAGYLGSHGVHLPFRSEEMDEVIPTLTSSGYVWPRPSGSGTRINPAFGNIRGVMFETGASYDALEVGLQKRMSHGLQAQGSFTWGKSIDNSSGSVAGDQFGNSIPALWNWFNTSVSRGVSDFNIGKTLVLNFTWDAPGLKSASGPANWITNGWELGAIYTASDGVPFTPTLGSQGDPLGLNGNHPQDYPNRLTGPGCGTLVNPGNPNNYIKTNCFAVPTAPSAAFYAANCDPAFAIPTCINLAGNAGRNILTGPGLSDLDFSLFKNNYIKRISENFNVQFRVEVFNILNRANFLPPTNPDNTDIFDDKGTASSVAGLLTSTGSNTSREIQFALKVIW
ncbi:MAG: TonB-dependent receptor domain-containing protein [Terriglobia bacterium]